MRGGGGLEPSDFFLPLSAISLIRFDSKKGSANFFLFLGFHPAASSRPNANSVRRCCVFSSFPGFFSWHVNVVFFFFFLATLEIDDLLLVRFLICFFFFFFYVFWSCSALAPPETPPPPAVDAFLCSASCLIDSNTARMVQINGFWDAKRTRLY